ncbi:hypothetical protein ES1_13570 [[Eubacterium] siraeum V10Sc8a]|uniref:Sigma-70 family RNA polymerase sigma factor n=1 Tax=[Eubacterium] siraeum V10Sc8a TaxID=717961 RepID=D4MKQ6_9FIRM|nr:hypothetical protein ES1_13570 [[Eubacterium] siraeum V10Sc8a]
MSKKYIIKNGTAVEVSEELHDYLTKSDRKIRYIEKDLKRNNYIIDSENEKVTVIPSREDSLDRLMDIGKDYPNQSSDFRQSTIEKIMLEKALEKLNEKERYLIVQLFYLGRTERDLAAELHIAQQNINKTKQRILCKLYEIFQD